MPQKQIHTHLYERGRKHRRAVVALVAVAVAAMLLAGKVVELGLAMCIICLKTLTSPECVHSRSSSSLVHTQVVDKLLFNQCLLPEITLWAASSTLLSFF